MFWQLLRTTFGVVVLSICEKKVYLLDWVVLSSSDSLSRLEEVWGLSWGQITGNSFKKALKVSWMILKIPFKCFLCFARKYLSFMIDMRRYCWDSLMSSWSCRIPIFWWFVSKVIGQPVQSKLLDVKEFTDAVGAGSCRLMDSPMRPRTKW
jgi:hypothetical protein